MRRVLALTLMTFATACRKDSAESDTQALVQVKTATVAIAPFADIISSIGTVSARAGHIASLSPPAPARIATVYVSQGQKVAAGTPLVAFEQAPFVAAAQSAEAGLTAAERSYERARRLADAGIIPRKDADQAATELAQARAAATTARRSHAERRRIESETVAGSCGASPLSSCRWTRRPPSPVACWFS